MCVSSKRSRCLNVRENLNGACLSFAENPDILADQLRDTPLAGDRYMGTFIESLRKDDAYPDYRCFAGVLMARIDPWGNVYPCLEQHVKIGSIRNQTFRSLWQSEAFNAERDRLRTRRACRCWYNNTALIGYYGNLLSKAAFPRPVGRSLAGGNGARELPQPCCARREPTK